MEAEGRLIRIMGRSIGAMTGRGVLPLNDLRVLLPND
jgi:hypothetical protein